MITYVDLFFPSGDQSASDVAQRLKDKVGLTFIRGTHDLCFRWEKDQEFEVWIERIHKALTGTGVIYRFISKDENREERTTDFVGWPPVGIPGQPLSRRDH
jgi:hypothetical protein